MKREILFRAKNHFSEWIYGGIAENTEGFHILIKRKNDMFWTTPVSKETVSQLLFEINGHRFFEGDVIGCDKSNARYVILWNEENQCFSLFNCYDLKNINEGDELLKLNTLCNMEQVRVCFLKKYNFYPVGNIFDNPEMMEAAN